MLLITKSGELGAVHVTGVPKVHHSLWHGVRFSSALWQRPLGFGIRRGCEKSITEAHEALVQAQAALRTYLERVDPDHEDLLRHSSLVDDLKLATDNLKNATDEYAYLVSNRAATIRPQST